MPEGSLDKRDNLLYRSGSSSGAWFGRGVRLLEDGRLENQRLTWRFRRSACNLG